jgi:hypothetical protein
MTPQWSPRAKEWTRRLLLMAASTAVTLIALEIGVRLALGRYRCDERLGWTYQPGKSAFVYSRTREFSHVVRFNNEGWHDADVDPAADSSVFRIFMLGDSFTAGLQVASDSTFLKRIERQLRPLVRSGRTIEIRNASVEGFSTAQSLGMFVDRVARYRPDVVFLGLFMWNDVADNAVGAGKSNHYLASRCGRPYYQLDRSGGVAEMDAGQPIRPSTSWLDRLLRRSEIYANLFPTVSRESASFSDWDVFLGKNVPAVDSAWQLTQGLIRELDEKVRSRGGRFAVVLIPHQEESKITVEQAAVRPQPPNAERMHARAEAFLRPAGIPYIDLYTPLRKALARGEHPYFQRDMHFNNRGHQIVADAIAQWIAGQCTSLSAPLSTCASPQPDSARKPRAR